MAKANFKNILGTFILENGLKERSMETVFGLIFMDKAIMDSGKRENLKAKEH